MLAATSTPSAAACLGAGDAPPMYRSWALGQRYHRSVQARVVTDIDLGKQLARRVEHFDDRFFVATENTVYAVEGDALVPVLEAARIIDMQGPLVLTPQHILELGGAPRPLPPLGRAEPAAFVPLIDGAVVAVHHALAAG